MGLSPLIIIHCGWFYEIHSIKLPLKAPFGSPIVYRSIDDDDDDGQPSSSDSCLFIDVLLYFGFNSMAQRRATSERGQKVKSLEMDGLKTRHLPSKSPPQRRVPVNCYYYFIDDLQEEERNMIGPNRLPAFVKYGQS